MKILILILLICFNQACVAKKISYTPNPIIAIEDAKTIIEQIITEQPAHLCPASTIIDSKYIEMNYGTQTRTSDSSAGVVVFDGFVVGSGHSTQTSRELKKRFYYNTILECKIFSRGSWFISQLIDTENRVMHNFYCRNELKAKYFSDAILSLKKEVKTPKEDLPPAEDKP